ncbi:MAG TPA: TA system VapC family ribonuclease toxin [Thermoanaerobaculia bacterium]|nr:TA system VapC family ribonuclease toxin [Thermoanaerobaculia bacterium]
MLVDANLLIYAVDEASLHHESAKDWLSSALNGETRVALPWLSLAAFVRILTNPRASDRPLRPEVAWELVEDWLRCDVAWIPNPTDHHATILGRLIRRYDLRANMITDAQLATLALEHGLRVYSADTDFARFTEIGWINPIAAS